MFVASRPPASTCATPSTMVEEGMRPDAAYLGVAVSGLDSSRPAPGPGVCRTAFSEQHIAAGVTCGCVDDTVMV